MNDTTNMTPLVKHMYNGAWPDQAEVAKLNEEFLYHRGIEAYMQTLPILKRSTARATASCRSGRTG